MKSFRKIGLLKLLILFLLSTFIISGCNNFSLSFSLSRELDGEYLGPLGISPSDAVVTAGKVITVIVSGGLEPYSYSCEKGEIDRNGVYTAPSCSAADLITVEDAYGDTVLSTIQIIENMQVSSVSKVLAPNKSSTFFVTGGLSPYTVSSTKGSALINGNTIDFTAQSSVSGNETDIITVTDSLGNTAEITVLVPYGTDLYIDPPAATINIGDSIDLQANNGNSPYTFSTGDPGVLSLLTLPTHNPATFSAIAAGTATVQVTDNSLATAQCVITVNSPDPLYLSPAGATVNVGDNIPFTASGGVPPYTYAVIAGAGTIDSGTGLYTAVKQGSDRVQATDTVGTTITAKVTVKK